MVRAKRTRRGWWWLLAAAVGAAVGGLVGGAIGYATYEPCVPEGFLDCMFAGPGWSATGGALLGLLPGAAVGVVLWVPGGPRALLAVSAAGAVASGLLFAGVIAGGGAPDDPVREAYDPTYSADGSSIAFVRAEPPQESGSIYVTTVDGREQRQLTACCAYDPAWSPDGTRIAFVRSLEVWVVNADGTGERPLTRGLPGQLEHPTWSPDGRRIAVATVDRGAIWIVTADGGQRRLLARSGPRFGWDPAWSPDGRRIAASLSGAIVVLDVDGTGMLQLTHPEGGDTDHTPAWAPDARKIAFLRRDDWGFSLRILVVDADGRSERLLATGSDPQWSPDGRKIVFERGGHLFEMDPDGSDQRRLIG